MEYIYRDQLGVYRLRVGESITDDDEYYIFRFEGKYVTVFKRKYDI